MAAQPTHWLCDVKVLPNSKQKIMLACCSGLRADLINFAI